VKLAALVTFLFSGVFSFAQGNLLNPFVFEPLNDSLISYWKMDEASGDRSDSEPTGTGNTLTDFNTVGSAAGILGNAASFVAASSEFFAKGDNADLSTGDIDFTIALWVFITDKSANRVPACKWVEANGEREWLIRYEQASDRFLFHVSSNGTATSSVTASNFGSPSTSTWYLIIAWHDSANNELGISVNNGTANTASYSSGVFDSPTALHVGTTGGGAAYWQGRIDEMGFWKKVLSPTERTEFYNAGVGKTCCPFASP